MKRKMLLLSVLLVMATVSYSAEKQSLEASLNSIENKFNDLLEKDVPDRAASRDEQNESFFVKMFSDPDMMKQVMDTVGGVLYERLRKGIHYDTTESAPVSMVAEDKAIYNTK